VYSCATSVPRALSHATARFLRAPHRWWRAGSLDSWKMSPYGPRFSDRRLQVNSLQGVVIENANGLGGFQA
ncbi:MAG: hypothetical protein WAM44_02865, partial [Chthoniobacterales bacterium]